jgi:hypothetical protein
LASEPYFLRRAVASGIEVGAKYSNLRGTISVDSLSAIL